MSDHLPEAVRQGLEAARQAAQRRSNRLCLHVGEAVHRVLRLWDGGLALAATDAPVRGYAELYDGPRHLSSCLLVAIEPEAGSPERVYEFKVRTPATDRAPVDFELPDGLPAGLLPRA